MRRSFEVEGKEVYIGATVGIAHAAGAALAPDELLRNADLAMYRAKKAGGNRVATYEGSMRTALLARIELEADLRHALERGELSLAYQPVVELRTGRPVGVEALARWTHPVRGPIPPLTFIPVAEEIGLIGAIGRWVLREACRQLAAWRLLAPELVLNVNLSALQLRDERLAGDVEQALLGYGLPGSALTLEITESMLLSGDEGTAARLRRLKALGLSIAVDDFGTGYSSLSYLKQFPVDALKIDKTFVDAVASSTEDSALARTIVELGRGMRLDTIAEGIENGEQLEQLRLLDCQLGQGYHFSHPLDGAELTAYLAADARRTSAARRSPARHRMRGPCRRQHPRPARSASSWPSPASTATTAGRRSSPARCATPAWRSSTPACTRRPSRSSRPSSKRTPTPSGCRSSRART